MLNVNAKNRSLPVLHNYFKKSIQWTKYHRQTFDILNIILIIYRCIRIIPNVSNNIKGSGEKYRLLVLWIIRQNNSIKLVGTSQSIKSVCRIFKQIQKVKVIQCIIFTIASNVEVFTLVSHFSVIRTCQVFQLNCKEVHEFHHKNNS